MNDTKRRRHDPDLRDRILEATLQVIAENGVAGTTHRKVAVAADVPLGSLTHRFRSLDNLLEAAFRRLSEDVSARFREALGKAKDVDAARDAVADLICDGSWTTPRNLALSYELYAYGARNDVIKQVQLDWMATCHDTLSLHFPPQVARTIDAFIEGATIHNGASPELLTWAEVRDVVAKLTS